DAGCVARARARIAAGGACREVARAVEGAEPARAVGAAVGAGRTEPALARGRGAHVGAAACAWRRVRVGRARRRLAGRDDPARRAITGGERDDLQRLAVARV